MGKGISDQEFRQLCTFAACLMDFPAPSINSRGQKMTKEDEEHWNHFTSCVPHVLLCYVALVGTGVASRDKFQKRGLAISDFILDGLVKATNAETVEGDSITDMSTLVKTLVEEHRNKKNSPRE
jgi:hypothetical protein